MKKRTWFWFKRKIQLPPNQKNEYQDLLMLYLAIVFFILLIRNFK